MPGRGSEQGNGGVYNPHNVLYHCRQLSDVFLERGSSSAQTSGRDPPPLHDEGVNMHPVFYKIMEHVSCVCGGVEQSMSVHLRKRVLHCSTYQGVSTPTLGMGEAPATSVFCTYQVLRIGLVHDLPIYMYARVVSCGFL